MNHKIYIIYIIIFTIIFLLSATMMFLLKKNILKIVLFNKPAIKKIALYIFISTSLLSAVGIFYCISYAFFPSNEITTINRPEAGNGDISISISTDSELYNGTIDLNIKDKDLTFEEVSRLFQKYRKELDSFVLGDNESFLKVTAPLNFPTSIGDENISISWYISNTDIIDYSGQILSENISEDGDELEIVATLTYDNNSADICYTVIAYKASLTPKEDLSLKLNTILNSNASLTDKKLTLPKEIDGMPIKFYETKSELPPLGFYCTDNHCSYFAYYLRA